MTHNIDQRKRWLALIVLCLGVLMIVLFLITANIGVQQSAACGCGAPLESTRSLSPRSS